MQRKTLEALAAIARNAMDLRYLRSLASSGLRFEQTGKLPSMHLLDAFPDLDALTVPLEAIRISRWSMDPMEVFVLMGLALLRQPRTIFEFGTYDGSSTLRLANAVPNAAIWTIDLPDTEAAAYRSSEGAQEDFAGIGAVFDGTPASQRITQLLGDSRTFDFSPWRGSIDMIVIDAAHTYEAVISDSRNALQMLAPNGLVIWDDYSIFWPNLMRAVDDFAEEHGLAAVQLLNTELAVYDRANSS